MNSSSQSRLLITPDEISDNRTDAQCANQFGRHRSGHVKLVLMIIRASITTIQLACVFLSRAREIARHTLRMFALRLSYS